MEKEKMTLQKIGSRGDFDRYMVLPGGAIGATNAAASINSQYGGDTIFDEEDGCIIQYRQVTVRNGVKRYYVPYGPDDELPYHVQELIGKNIVMSQCQSYNTLSLYGKGVRFVDRATGKDTQDPDIRAFCLDNSLHEQFLEQATDMMYYYWTVSVIELCRDGSKIVNIRHKEACYCRLEKPEHGRIKHLFYGNFRRQNPTRVDEYPLLDLMNPLGDLMVRMGRAVDPATGRKRTGKEITKDRIFAVVSRMPTPGYQFYPIPYYFSVWRDAWYDIYRLIGIGKRYMIKNTSAPRIQIEIHKDYWMNLCDEENIIDEDERKRRVMKEKQDIIDFVCGPENAGKGLITGYYVDPNGKENRMIRIINLNEGNKKEGGDWSDDMQEAANVLCFALGVHPNLIGATPGKSQMNNSGSDKRELATLKQMQQTPYREIMLKPYHVVLHYNGLADKFTVDCPIMQLTTLDKKKDMEESRTHDS